MRRWTAGVALCLALGCAREPGKEPFTGEPFLFVWAGDADRQHADFLAVIDADPNSASYGKVLRTVPVRSRGNEPDALDAKLRDDRQVFATGLLTGRVFAFDARDPLATRVARVDEPTPARTLAAPGGVTSVAGGRVVVACADPARYRNSPRELLASPGGLLEFSADGRLVREASAADPNARAFLVAPHRVAAGGPGGRLLTTSTGHGYAATTQGERVPGISVQVWRTDGLRLERTVVLEAGPRGEENLAPVTPTWLGRQSMALVDTELGGGLYASDSLAGPVPAFRLVFDFGAGSLPGGAAVTPDDRWYVVALGGRHRVASLDLADPWHPRAVSSVRLDRDPLDAGRSRAGGPNRLAMSAAGTRVAVSDYGVDVPGYFRDGDHRVYLLRLDPATGALRIDTAFRDELSGEVGVGFNRVRWPHGETGGARPAGLLFVAEEPPRKR
jgi:hypothetical protein